MYYVAIGRFWLDCYIRHKFKQDKEEYETNNHPFEGETMKSNVDNMTTIQSRISEIDEEEGTLSRHLQDISDISSEILTFDELFFQVKEEYEKKYFFTRKNTTFCIKNVYFFKETICFLT